MSSNQNNRPIAQIYAFIYSIRRELGPDSTLVWDLGSFERGRKHENFCLLRVEIVEMI